MNWFIWLRVSLIQPLTASSDLSILHLSSNIFHILKFRRYVCSPCSPRSAVLQVWPGPPFYPSSDLQCRSHHLTLFTSFPKASFLLSCQGSIYSPPPISNLICKVLSETFIPTFLPPYHMGLQYPSCHFLPLNSRAWRSGIMFYLLVFL